jgi:dolichyl-phosphate beta-glucosyltransferase
MEEKSATYLSMIIPAYNEELRLPHVLDSIINYFENQDYSYEIIIVDDGSTDKTRELIENNKFFPDKVKLIVQPKNMGKGSAVKAGVEQASGELLIYNDADGSTPIEETEKLLKAIDSGSDIAIGSRALKESNVDESRKSRKILSGLFSFQVRLFILGNIQDSQCGFKMFKAEYAKKIFTKLILLKYTFDIEVLLLGKKMGCKIAEVPITWNSVAGSKVNPWIDTPAMSFSVFVIKFLDIIGRYKV